MTKRFHSADFDKTPPHLTAHVPSKLIHRAVDANNQQAAYSNERKHPVAFVDLPSLTISVTIGGLLPGDCSNKHRHSYETVIYILEGEGYSEIEGQKVNWQAGDALYVPVWAWHQHFNANAELPAKYLACENAPLLQNLGQIAIREEAK